MCYNFERKRQIIKLNDNNFLSLKMSKEKSLKHENVRMADRLLRIQATTFFPLFSCFCLVQLLPTSTEMIYMLVSKGKKKWIKRSKFWLIDSLELVLLAKPKRAKAMWIAVPHVGGQPTLHFSSSATAKVGMLMHTRVALVRATNEQVGGESRNGHES